MRAQQQQNDINKKVNDRGGEDNNKKNWATCRTNNDRMIGAHSESYSVSAANSGRKFMFERALISSESNFQ